jgi:cell division protein FtsB
MRSASAPDRLAWIRRHGLTVLLGALIVLIQYPLWLGQGGWLAVRVGSTKLQNQLALNQRLRERNDTLLAEVSDLKQGRDAIEERARNELGMIAPDEVFVRVVAASSVMPAPAVTPEQQTNPSSETKHE